MKCILCNNKQELWSHIWKCSHLQTRIHSLITTTKEALLTLIGCSIPNLSASFIFSFNSLPCWNLSSSSQLNNQVSFDFMTKCFVLTSLTNLLFTVTNQ